MHAETFIQHSLEAIAAFLVLQSVVGVMLWSACKSSNQVEHSNSANQREQK